MTISQPAAAPWMADGTADPALVATEIAKGPQVPVPPGYWGVEAITGCGHRMAHSGFAVHDVAVETALQARSWTECEECGRELGFHAGVTGSVIFLELRRPAQPARTPMRSAQPAA
jgi:hypothetical protein